MLCKLLFAGLALVCTASAQAAPSVVFVLLDTTRADRFSAWGNDRPTTPSLDELAAGGVVFRRHFTNAHATRSSMPQLMSGRYYHQNILRSFTPDAHPREFPFSRPDPTVALLPGVLRASGYATLGVSSHPWVVAHSPFGRHFDRFEFVGDDPKRGYANAREVVDGAIAMWRVRDRERPLFLYVHLMDLHMPRRFPAERRPFDVIGFDWRQRFDPGSRPLFDPEPRRWTPYYAADFSELDRRHFAAVYDTRLAYTDAELGRLLAALRADDPALRQTVVVVVADHGEELGEEGRTSHGDALADGVQHIPWIMAGGDVVRGQRTERFTENVDVLPTVLALLRLAPPLGTHTDGRPQLAADGHLRADAGKAAAFYAWEDYRGIRTRRHLLRLPTPASFEARCQGGELLYGVEDGLATRLDPAGRERHLAARLRARLARRLDARERAFQARRWGSATTPFFVRPAYWRVAAEARITCAPVDWTTDGAELRRPGWLWSGRGVTVLEHDGDTPLPLTVLAPDGEYRVEAAVVAIDRMPWFFGFDRWRRRSFLHDTPESYVSLGTHRAVGGRLSVSIPPAAAFRRHVVGIRLSPAAAPSGSGLPATAEPSDDPQLRERLKALGYVE